MIINVLYPVQSIITVKEGLKKQKKMKMALKEGCLLGVRRKNWEIFSLLLRGGVGKFFLEGFP